VHRAYLLLESDDQVEQKVLIDGPVVIGRTSDCGFVIEDSAASRRHVRIEPRRGGFFWKDLGSTNGTRINGLAMLEGQLKSGDRIQIGGTVLRFDVEEGPEPAGEPEGTPMFVETVFDQAGEATTLPPPGKAGELLRAAYAVSNAIASNYDPCKLVDQILETTMRAIKGQRGAIFFTDASKEQLQPCPMCRHVHLIEDGVLRHATSAEIRISHTVAQRVLKNGESVLFQDTGSDGELRVAESIVSLQLRSIICVPIRGKSGIFGILYIDSDRADRQYTQEDMLLSSAVGNSAGLAIENAHMHRQILDKQRIEQEIEYAWIIQQGFLVKEWPEDDPRFQVYGETRPAKTIGGDFYDFVRPRPHVAGMLIGDVSGKGVAAALTMAQLLAAFRITVRDVASPAQVIATLNQDLVVRSQRGTFCTLCYIAVDLATGKALCANAGHMPALHLTPRGAQLLVQASGPPIGILPDAAWTNTECLLAPDDGLLLYTDGITEARSMSTRHGAERLDEPDEYGIESLREVAETHYGKPPHDLFDTVIADVRRYCEPSAPHDDCTMIALRYLGGDRGS